MQELLNEQEFLKPPYNPWRWFKIFYGIAIIQLIVLYFIISNTIGEPAMTILFLMALIIPLAMFFANKKRKDIPLNTFAYASLILSAIYFFGLNIVKIIYRPTSFFISRTVNEAPKILAGLFVYYSICLIIIMIYLKIKRDIQKIKTAESK